jgi:hypothetical protein
MLPENQDGVVQKVDTASTSRMKVSPSPLTSEELVHMVDKSVVMCCSDLIHANKCVPSMLHQCLIQWVGDDVKVIIAGDLICTSTAEPRANVQDGDGTCLSERDLSEYDYINVSKDELVHVNVKSTSMTQLSGSCI